MGWRSLIQINQRFVQGPNMNTFSTLGFAQKAPPIPGND
jgi:hypothetical protein